MTDTKVKENAIVDFMEMTYHSWTWLRMTKEEQERFEKELEEDKIMNAIIGNYDQRWHILQALYSMYLEGLGYTYEFREKESDIADDIERFMFERGEYDYTYVNDKIRWITIAYDRQTTTWNILNDILRGDIKPLIDYLESEICVMADDDESILLAKRALKTLKEEYKC